MLGVDEDVLLIGVVFGELHLSDDGHLADDGDDVTDDHQHFIDLGRDEVIESVDDQIKAKTGSDELVLSETAETALANAEFDSAKVARIKAAIQEGNYPIDAKKVAESFAALEGMISSN